MSELYESATREISRRNAIKVERQQILVGWRWFVRSIYFYLASLVVFPLIAALIIWSLLT